MEARGQSGAHAELEEVYEVLKGCYAQVELMLDEVRALPEEHRHLHSKQEHVENRMFEFSKVVRSICRCLQRISPAVTPAI